MRTELLFVRHGTTDGNSHGLLHGRTDVPLAESGRNQARRVATKIAQTGQVRSIYSSPLKRAVDTAGEISRATQVEIAIEPDLAEFDFGDLEGLAFEDLQVSHPDLYLSMIDPGSFDRRFPNGESLSVLHRRVSRALERIGSENREGRVVVVAHLIVIAAAVTHLTSGDPHDVIRYLVRNCSITHIELNGNSSAEIHSLDDISHLE